jgi:integrase
MRRKRYQNGSLQKRNHRGHKVWVGLWRDEENIRRYQTFGRCSEITQADARRRLNEILAPLNENAALPQHEPTTFEQLVTAAYIPFCRRKWKASTAGTTEQRIRTHLLPHFGNQQCRKISRDELQDFLDAKAASGLSFSLVDHLRWDLRAIFEMGANEGLVSRNPAKLLYTSREAVRGDRRIMNEEEVRRCLSVLSIRERLIAKLAIFAGMRPGEIFGLMWGHIAGDRAEIRQRVYRGKLDTPKTTKSLRTAALSPTVLSEIEAWRALSLEAHKQAWVFPSEGGKTPLSKDNCWRRHIEPQLRKVGLQWANFQVMRRTHASKSYEYGVDPKVVADQLGHGIGVNLDVYTRTGHTQRAEAVRLLEKEILQ